MATKRTNGTENRSPKMSNTKNKRRIKETAIENVKEQLLYIIFWNKICNGYDKKTEKEENPLLIFDEDITKGILY